MSQPDRVALVHYHARGGGVTRVLEHQQTVLERECIRTCILLGEEPPANTPLHNVVVDPILGYSDKPLSQDGAAITRQITDAVRKQLGGIPDLWHIHNHSLGKNLTMPLLVNALATRGDKLLLQIHDFAEDGRPDRYALLRSGLGDALGKQLYPIGSGVHYATLNSRDYGFLQAAGAPETHVHQLPNAVHVPDLTEEKAPPLADIPNNLILYPTRAIRRKNIGEVLLWAAAFGGEQPFGVTLAPQNPVEQPLYEHWKALAFELKLPLLFELGLAHDFAALVQHSQALITTSVAEGFGLAFLEPFLMNRPLCGRDLPEITQDFSEQGISFDSLYQHLPIPKSCIDLDPLYQTITHSLTQSWESYGVKPDASALENAYNATIIGENIDFGTLPFAIQNEIIQYVNADSEAQKQLCPRLVISASAICKNRDTILSKFSLDTMSSNLLLIYRSVLGSPSTRCGSLEAARLLACFLNPGRFNLLRSSHEFVHEQ